MWPDSVTGRDLLAWRQQHHVPRKALAAAVGYASGNTITMIELYRSHVPRRIQAYLATATPPPVLTGPQLRTWREAHGWTRTQLGRLVGRATTSAVTMWELGYRTVPWRVRVYVQRHPAPPPRPVRVAPPEPGTRADVLALVQMGPTTVAAIRLALPYRISREALRRHLRVLESDGWITRTHHAHGRCLWQTTPAGRRWAGVS